MTWTKTRPTLADLNGATHAYWWVRGADYNRPTICCVHHGAALIGGKWIPLLNFTFEGPYPPNLTEFPDGYPGSHSLTDYRQLLTLEWAGPIPEPTRIWKTGSQEHKTMNPEIERLLRQAETLNRDGDYGAALTELQHAIAVLTRQVHEQDQQLHRLIRRMLPPQAQ